jgi:hypothetical protein
MMQVDLIYMYHAYAQVGFVFVLAMGFELNSRLYWNCTRLGIQTWIFDFPQFALPWKALHRLRNSSNGNKADGY